MEEGIFNSYKNNAIVRLNEIEHTLNLISSKFGQNGGIDDSKIQILMIQNYIKWINHSLNKYSRLMVVKEKLKRRKNGMNICSKEEALFFRDINQGILYFNKLNNSKDEFFNLFNYITNYPKIYYDVSAPLICGLKSSQLIKCFINVYFNFMDPNMLWLNRNNLIQVIQSEERSLLKFMLIQAFDKLIKFPQLSLYKFLGWDQLDFKQLLLDSLNVPSLQNLTGLTMLSMENFFKGDIIFSYLNLKSALEMKNRLTGFDDQSNITQDDLIWKEQIMDIIDFLSLVIGSRFEKSMVLQPFKAKYIKYKRYCAPTLSRLVKNDNVYLTSSQRALTINKMEYQRLIKQEGFQNAYYAFAAFVEMEIHRYHIFYEIMYNNNKHIINDINQYYQFKEQIKQLSSQIDDMLIKTPKEYKIYNLITKRQRYYLKTYGQLFLKDTVSFGNYAYAVILGSKLSLLDPLIYISDAPHTIPKEYYNQACQTATLLWNIVYSMIQLNFKKKDISHEPINNIMDYITLVKFSLNVIIMEQSTIQEKEYFYNKIKIFINFIKGTINTERGFLDDNIALERIKNVLQYFILPKEYFIEV